MNEYELTTGGVQLLGGRTWQDADHLNVRTDQGTVNYHAEAKCAAAPAPVECTPMMQSAAQSIGTDFIPWGALGIDPSSCIEWVQFSRANYHYGEAGESPLCLVVDEEPPVTPEPEPEPENPVIPPYTPRPPLECPEGSSPGEPDDQGAPTACVTDKPAPTPERPEPELPDEPEVTPPSELECPDGTVPGWLDKEGNPQGCVDNRPTPGEPKPETPSESTPAAPPAAEEVQGVSQPATLAETGADGGVGALLALVLIAAGLATVVAGKVGVRRGR